MKPFLFSKRQRHYVRFFVPTALQEHLGKKYLFFPLGTGAGHEVRLKAHQIAYNLTNTCNELLENLAMNKPRLQDFDLSNIRTYEIDRPCCTTPVGDGMTPTPDGLTPRPLSLGARVG